MERFGGLPKTCIRLAAMAPSQRIYAQILSSRTGIADLRKTKCEIYRSLHEWILGNSSPTCPLAVSMREAKPIANILCLSTLFPKRHSCVLTKWLTICMLGELQFIQVITIAPVQMTRRTCGEANKLALVSRSCGLI